jgi:hypothetical protein
MTTTTSPQTNTTQRGTKRPRDHWQDEKDRLIAELERKILGRREQISVQEILAVEQPELLRAAFRKHARSIVRRERPLVLQSSHQFVLDDDEIKSHLRRLRELLAERVVLTRDEVHEVIAFGVPLQFDVITKPRAALVSLLYDKSLERQRDDIATIVAGLGEERPMIAALLSIIGSYPPGPVNREAFVALCRRAEKMAYGEKPVTALIADLRDFLAFSSAIDGRQTSEIDNQTVLGILFERNLKALAEGLLPTLTHKDKWTLQEVEKALEHQILTSGLALGKDEPGQVFLPATVDLSAFLEETKREVTQRFHGEDQEGIQKNIPLRVNENMPPAPALHANGNGAEQTLDMFSMAAENEAAASNDLTQREPRAAFRQPAQPSTSPRQPLSDLIDDKSRMIFLRKIFKRDEAAYRRFVEVLERADTWKTAKEILDEELSRREINPYSKEAIRLSDVVFSRYFSRR